MDEKKVIETKLTEYENEQLKLLKSVFDMGCAFKMLALQKEANDWELKYLNGKRDFEYAQGQIERILIAEDLLKKQLAKKESDTAREIFEKIFEVLCCFTTQGKSKEYAEGFIDCLEEVDKRLQNLAKEKYGVDLGG